MPRFTKEIIENKKSKNGLVKRKTIRLKAKNNNPITFGEVRQFYNGLVNGGEDPSKISVSGMNIDKYLTIKAFADNDIKAMDDEEYYVNKTNNPQKYESFFYVDFYLK
jgi:hypothetical protein